MPHAVTHTMKKRLVRALLASALSLYISAPALHAQPSPSQGKTWYQVEVILFAQSDSFGNEKNLKSVRLGYPRAQVFLDTATEVPPETLARLSPEDLQLYLAMVPETLLRRRDPTTPVPFAPLSPRDHLLTAEARNLERSGSFQVLFHQAWRQTLDGPRDSPWVIIQGGEQVGEHHELEGSLRIYTDTQIFAQTNLWRTRFGQTVSASPARAALPLMEESGGAPPGNGQSAPDWPALPPAPQPPEPQLPPLFREATAPTAFAVDARDTAALQAARYAPAVMDIDRFELNQIINTRELHYLDHPRLGALIRVVPYDPEQREEELFDDMPVEDTGLDLEAPLPEIDDDARD